MQEIQIIAMLRREITQLKHDSIRAETALEECRKLQQQNKDLCARCAKLICTNAQLRIENKRLKEGTHE